MNSSETIIYGIRAVEESLASGKTIDKIFVQWNLKKKFPQEFFEECSRRKIQVQFVPSERMNRQAGGNHRGIFAIISPIEFAELENIIPSVYEKGNSPLIVVLDRITDVHNLGAIARSAEAMDADAIILPVKESAQINEQAIRISAGALLHIPLCRSDNLEETVCYMKNSGLQIIAGTEKGEHLPDKVNFSLPTALVLGSEHLGVSAHIISQCDETVRIPLMGKVVSLNVSVAAGILLYEVFCQRKKRKA